MPRYIDADFAQLIADAELDGSGKGTVHWVLAHTPTANAQEVVRCKNCRFFDPYDKVEDFDGRCVVRDCETDKEEFCSYGSKRGDEK